MNIKMLLLRSQLLACVIQLLGFLHSSVKTYIYFLEEMTEHFSHIGMEYDVRLVNFSREENS